MIAEQMRRDWDERAERDAHFYIASATTEAGAFWRSGEEELTALILSDVELQPDASTLEIGCGIGRLIRPLSKRSASVLGVDISPRMVAEARRACEDLENVRIAVTTGALPMVEDQTQDFVFSYIVFQHIPDTAAVDTYIREAARVLRAGGVFHFQVDGRVRRRDQYRPNTYEGITLDAAEVRQMVEAVGLEVVRQWGEDTHYLWTTARRKGNLARLRIIPRIRDEFEMRSFEDRLSMACGVSILINDESKIRNVIERFVQAFAERSPAEFVSAAFRVILAREALPAELEFNRSILERGLETPANWIDTIVTSTELRSRLMPPVPRVTDAAEERLRPRLSMWCPPGASLADLMESVGAQLRRQDSAQAVRRAYQLILCREPDPNGHRYFTEKLELGHFTVMKVVAELLLSEELQTGVMPTL